MELHQISAQVNVALRNQRGSSGNLYEHEKDYHWAEDAWIMRNLKQNSKILEIGYGAGGLLLNISQHMKNVELYGTDTKKSVAVKRIASLVVSDVKHLPFKSQSLDVIICRDLLHHLYGKRNAHKALQEIHRALRKRGSFIVVEVTMTNRLLTELVYCITRTLALLKISDYVLRPRFTRQRNVVVNFFTLSELVKSSTQLLTLEKIKVSPVAKRLFQRVFLTLNR